MADETEQRNRVAEAGGSLDLNGQGTGEGASALLADEHRSDNEAVEIVEGKIEKVSVSKHPEASIPQTDLSLADIQRSQFHPVRWAVYVVILLVAIIVPYWIGRVLAVRQTAPVVRILSHFSPQGVALISWTVMVFVLATFALSFVEAHAWLWRNLFLLSLAVEQLIGGICLLKFKFWFSTYVVYQASSVLVNAANLGIIAALLAAGVFVVLFVGLLIGIKKDSSLNILTRSWAAFLMFFVIEGIALLIVLWSGLLTAV
ncbi:hypothetical protein OZX57_07110 [Bifidobacterium sp. ESL0682]|uniref:hypothetical protein n=1 Tax=Bifidobacterium sp. ESL0682 TaxID=2983212 RepID=UPI0023F9C36B|nr:hypothetical protein [Bifidobacterium sp. ESL0682]WEV41733.1 hypothetical protein OZX57_07110 [Bifidobacterium sp. ESL0682]